MAARKVQVVFQGGGAKLYALMAVCEVLHKYAYGDNPRIEISRLAGSSAGAIAATMLASRVEMRTYEQRLRGIASTYLPRLKVSKARGAWRLFNGQPWFGDIALEQIFEKLFVANKCSIKEIAKGTKLDIFVTDLYRLESETVQETEAIAVALAHSCRVPFAFGGSSSDNYKVDGGLALNLPVDLLLADKDSSVIAISFDNVQDHDVSKKNGKKSGSRLIPLVDYTLTLFSAAIQSGVTRSQGLVGQSNVYACPTSIDTFEFDSLEDFFGAPLSSREKSKHDEIRDHFEKWLKDWLGPREDDTQTYFLRATTGHVPLAILDHLREDFKRLPRIKSKWMNLFDVAMFDKGKFNHRYKTTMMNSLTVVEPTRILQTGFQIGAKEAVNEAKVMCAVRTLKGATVHCQPLLQEIRRDETYRTFRLLYQFEQYLKPGDEYLMQYEYEAADPYPDFPHGSGRENAVMTALMGFAEQMTLIMAFPKHQASDSVTIKDIIDIPAEEYSSYKLSSGYSLIASEAMSWVDAQRLLQLRTDDHFIVGRTVRNVPHGKAFGFVVDGHL